MRKYRVDRWEGRIRPVEVERETAKTVVVYDKYVGEMRLHKRSEWHRFFDTWEEARGHVLGVALLRLRDAHGAVLRAQERLSAVEDLPEHDPDPQESERP